MGRTLGFLSSIHHVHKDACLVQRPLEAQDDMRLAESQLAQAQQDLVRLMEETSVSDDPPPEQVPRCDSNEELHA